MNETTSIWSQAGSWQCFHSISGYMNLRTMNMQVVDIMSILSQLHCIDSSYIYSTFQTLIVTKFTLTKLFQGCAYFVVALFFHQVLKLLFQIMLFQKIIALVTFMVFATQGTMAAPQDQPDLKLRDPQPWPPAYRPHPKRDAEN